MQHGGRAEGLGLCQQPRNPTDPGPGLRALFVALDQWVTEDIAPPDSRVPRASDDTAVFSEPQSTTVTGLVPQSALGFPNIPSVTCTGLITTRYLFDFGPSFDEGIISKYPPSFADRPTYPSFVAKTDQDGNEIAVSGCHLWRHHWQRQRAGLCAVRVWGSTTDARGLARASPLRRPRPSDWGW